MADQTTPGDAAGHSDADSDLRPRFDVVPGSGQRSTVVRAAGDIDLISAPQLQAALLEAAAISAEITADMTAVTYCDSAAIHALINVARDNRLTILVPEDGPITTMLKIVSLDQIATVITVR